MFKSSWGSRYWYSPFLCPPISSPTFASTSFAFMFVDVPAPPWYQSTWNWSWYLPSMTALQAFSIMASRSGFIAPTAVFARAAASFTIAHAST